MLGAPVRQVVMKHLKTGEKRDLSAVFSTFAQWRQMSFAGPID